MNRKDISKLCDAKRLIEEVKEKTAHESFKSESDKGRAMESLFTSEEKIEKAIEVINDQMRRETLSPW